MDHALFSVLQKSPPLYSRVGSGISFRKNSAEQTRNSFRYSAEESAHSETFRSLLKSLFRSEEQKEMAWKKLVLQKILLKQTELTACFHPRHASERKSELLSLLRNVSEQNSKCLLIFLFHGTELFSLPQNGSEGNSERLLLTFFMHGKFWEIFSSAERFGTEFWEFSVPRNSRNSAGTSQLFPLFRLPRNNFLVGNCQPYYIVQFM